MSEVSRITTGRIHLQLERVALNDIVEGAVGTVRPYMHQRQHELTVSPSPQPIWLNADPARLEQVIVSLLTNSAKYSPNQGQISLVVQRAGDEVVLRVKDTGSGIPPELLSHDFELFSQAEQSLDRSQGGLGIGLCLVQQLMELHGGHVEVESTLGLGSEFVVHLPILSRTATPSPTSYSGIPELTGPSLRVLVVDDNVDVVESLALLIEASGHDLRTAFDGPTALKVVYEFKPQVVLLDIGLPEMNGYEVAQRLREVPDFGSVILVALTGYGHEADKQRSQEAGFNQHLVKPADSSQIQQILENVSTRVTEAIENGKNAFEISATRTPWRVSGE